MSADWPVRDSVLGLSPHTPDWPTAQLCSVERRLPVPCEVAVRVAARDWQAGDDL